MRAEADVVSKKLFGYTTVCSLEFNYDPQLGVCDALLRLQSPKSKTEITLVMNDVSGLRIDDFGGGLTQLLFLTIEDVREKQHDRVNFIVKELERHSFECGCRSLEISE